MHIYKTLYFKPIYVSISSKMQIALYSFLPSNCLTVPLYDFETWKVRKPIVNKIQAFGNMCLKCVKTYCGQTLSRTKIYGTYLTLKNLTWWSGKEMEFDRACTLRTSLQRDRSKSTLKGTNIDIAAWKDSKTEAQYKVIIQTFYGCPMLPGWMNDQWWKLYLFLLH